MTTKPKVGRPRRANKVSDARIELRVTASEYKQLKAEAESRGLTLADFVRISTFAAILEAK